MPKRSCENNLQMTSRCKSYVAVAVITVVVVSLISCATDNNPDAGRILISIAVTPTTANAATFPNGQVTFTATGTFNLPPITAPVTSAAPYTGSFFVDNPTGQTIANIVSTGNGTATVECASGVVGNVNVTASASANDQLGTIITGNAQLSCP